MLKRITIGLCLLNFIAACTSEEVTESKVLQEDTQTITKPVTKVDTVVKEAAPKATQQVASPQDYEMLHGFMPMESYLKLRESGSIDKAKVGTFRVLLDKGQLSDSGPEDWAGKISQTYEEDLGYLWYEKGKTSLSLLPEDCLKAWVRLEATEEGYTKMIWTLDNGSTKTEQVYIDAPATCIYTGKFLMKMSGQERPLEIEKAEGAFSLTLLTEKVFKSQELTILAEGTYGKGRAYDLLFVGKMKEGVFSNKSSEVYLVEAAENGFKCYRVANELESLYSMKSGKEHLWEYNFMDDNVYPNEKGILAEKGDLAFELTHQ